MKINEVRDLSTDALKTQINDSKEELMRLRFRQATGELTDYTQLRHTRRTIARLYTILRERLAATGMEGEE
jgi:large subunit ribosomal protein L29